jgi:hypothetical protein
MNCLYCGKPTGFKIIKGTMTDIEKLYCNQKCNSFYHAKKLNKSKQIVFDNQIWIIQSIVNELTQLKLEWIETINYIKEKMWI